MCRRPKKLARLACEPLSEALPIPRVPPKSIRGEKKRSRRFHGETPRASGSPTNSGSALDAYLEDAGIRHQKKTLLFRSARGKTKTLTENPMARADVYRMIRRRARDAGIQTPIGCHSFRATGITAYLKNGGRLELAQQMAGHESARTTGLYDRRDEEITLDEVERVVI